MSDIVWLCFVSDIVWLCFVSDIVWLCFVSDIAWLCFVSDIVWLCFVSDIVWLCFVSDIVWLCFDVSLTVHLSKTLANGQLDAQIFNTFITILYMYMFRAISRSSSGAQIVLTLYTPS